jgi:hypothetical protein
MTSSIAFKNQNPSDLFLFRDSTFVSSESDDTDLLKGKKMNTTNVTKYTDWDPEVYYRGRQTVGALFTNRADAETAINALKARGFRGDQIGIAMRDRTEQGTLIEDTGSKAAESAATGAAGGALLGGVVGFLVGIGALVIPGIGPIVSAGVLTTVLGTAGVTTLAGAGIGAATGGLVGALVGMGIPETEATYFETGFRKGHILVTVNTEKRVADAVDVLQQYGGDLGVSTMQTSKATTTVIT